MKKLLATLMTVAALVGCGGGGNGSGGAGQTHNELAQTFVNALNASGVYDVTLVKSSTLEYNYVVVYDADYGTYDAIYIGGFNPGQDVVSYMANNSNVYYDLDIIPAHYEYDTRSYYDSFCNCFLVEFNETYIPDRYRDPYTGTTFEKSTEKSKDVEMYAALAEERVVTSRAEKVANNFGLSVDRSKEVVRLAMAWQKSGGKDLTDADQDSFSEELLGFSITEAKSALRAKAEGQSEAVEDLIQRAADTNHTSPEHINQIINTYVGQ